MSHHNIWKNCNVELSQQHPKQRLLLCNRTKPCGLGPHCSSLHLPSCTQGIPNWSRVFQSPPITVHYSLIVGCPLPPFWLLDKMLTPPHNFSPSPIAERVANKKGWGPYKGKEKRDFWQRVGWNQAQSCSSMDFEICSIYFAFIEIFLSHPSAQ